jgi:hypothetical protein
MRNPLREICTVGSVRGSHPDGAMVDLNGHEAGNGRYSQGTPTAYRGSSTRRDACCKPLGVGCGGVRLNFPAWCRPTTAYARTSCEREPCYARRLMKGDLTGGWVVYPKLADSLSKFCTNRASEFLAPEVE